MNEQKRREYTAPEIESLFLEMEPFLLNEGQTGSGVGGEDTTPTTPTTGAPVWSPWL